MVLRVPKATRDRLSITDNSYAVISINVKCCKVGETTGIFLFYESLIKFQSRWMRHMWVPGCQCSTRRQTVTRK